MLMNRNRAVITTKTTTNQLDSNQNRNNDSFSSSWPKNDPTKGRKKNTLLPINEALKQLHHIGPTKTMESIDLHVNNNGNKQKIPSNALAEVDLSMDMDRLELNNPKNGIHRQYAQNHYYTTNVEEGTNPVKISPNYVPLSPLQVKKSYTGEKKARELQEDAGKEEANKDYNSKNDENGWLKMKKKQGVSNKVKLDAVKPSPLPMVREKKERNKRGDENQGQRLNNNRRQKKKEITCSLDEVAIIPSCLLNSIIDTPNHEALEEAMPALASSKKNKTSNRKRKTSTANENSNISPPKEIIIEEFMETPRSARSSFSKGSKVSSETSTETKSIVSVSSIVSRSSQDIIDVYRQALYQNSDILEDERREELERNNSPSKYVFLTKEDYYRIRATHLLAQRRQWEAKVERAKDRKAATEIWTWLRYEAKKEWILLRNKRKELKEHQRTLLMVFQMTLKHKAIGVAIQEVKMLKNVRFDDIKRTQALHVIDKWINGLKYRRMLGQKGNVQQAISKFCQTIRKKWHIRRKLKSTDLLRKFLRDARRNATRNYILRLRKRIALVQKLCRNYAECRQARLELVIKVWRKVWREKREEQRKQRTKLEERSMQNALQNRTIGNYVKKMYASKTVIEQNLHACNASVFKLKKYNQFEDARRLRKENKEGLGNDFNPSKNLKQKVESTENIIMERDLSPNEMVCIEEILYEQRKMHIMTDHTRYETSIHGKQVERQDAVDLIQATDEETVYEISRKIAMEKVIVKRFTPFQMFFCHGCYLYDLVDEKISEIFEQEQLEKSKREQQKLHSEYQQWLKDNEGKEDPYLMVAGGTAPPSSALSLGVHGDSRRRQSVVDGTIFLQKEKEMKMIRETQENEKQNKVQECQGVQAKVYRKGQQFSN